MLIMNTGYGRTDRHLHPLFAVTAYFVIILDKVFVLILRLHIEGVDTPMSVIEISWCYN